MPKVAEARPRLEGLKQLYSAVNPFIFSGVAEACPRLEGLKLYRQFVYIIFAIDVVAEARPR